jgi:triphosphatase
MLGKRVKKLAKKIAKLDALSPRQRHRLRIATKKLRYAAEFFAGFFGGRKRGARRRRVNKILEKLQASLGTLNDIEAHKRVAKSVIGSDRRRGETVRKKAEKSFAMGFISGQEQKQAASCLAAAAKAGRRLSDAKQFWR